MAVAVDDHHALAEPRRRQRMRQPANAGADHRDVECTWQMISLACCPKILILLSFGVYGRAMKAG